MRTHQVTKGILLLIISFSIKAQSYIPVPLDSLHFWTQSTVLLNSQTYCYAKFQMKVKYQRTFNGKLYSYIGEFGPPSVVPPNTNPQCHDLSSYSGLVRQDTLEKKIWIVEDTINFNEYLLYDFSLNIGDTAKYLCLGCANPPVVSATNTVMLGDGLAHRVISYTIQPSFESGYCDIIEGVGSTCGFFQRNYYTGIIDPYEFALGCFGKIISYPDSVQSIYGGCIIATGFRDLSSPVPVLSVYPNPVSNNLELNFSTMPEVMNCRVQITNSLGKVVKEIRDTELKIEDKRLRIDVSDLPVGFYVLSIQGKNIRSVVKFVKD